MIPRWILYSSMLIFAVALLGRIFGDRVSGKLRYVVWLAVLCRLLIPVQLFHYEVPLSPKIAFPEGVQEQVIALYPERPESAVRVTADGDIFVPTSAAVAVAEKSQRSGLDELSAMELIQFVWLMGSVIAGTVFAVTNLSFGYQLRKERVLTDIDYEIPVYAIRGIHSPCLFGLLRPAMYIPEKMMQDTTVLRHALAHEYAHYEQGDHLWGALRCVALSIHWWNPLVWWALVLSKRDGELAADEGALRILRFRHRRAYGETLLALVTAHMKPLSYFSCAAAMTAAKRGLWQRIRRIANRKRYRVMPAMVMVLIMSLVTVWCFMEPAAHAVGSIGGVRYEFLTVLPHQPDLNHDGQTEILTLGYREMKTGGFSYLLEIHQGEEVLWFDTAETTTAGWNALFLTEVGGKDYLLNVTSKAYLNQISYGYILFALTDSGSFRIWGMEDFQIDLDSGDVTVHGDNVGPDDVSAAVEKVNGYLARGHQLLNTNKGLLQSFHRSGALRDEPWWLDELSNVLKPEGDLSPDDSTGIPRPSVGARKIVETMLTAPDTDLQYVIGCAEQADLTIGRKNRAVTNNWDTAIKNFIAWDNWQGEGAGRVYDMDRRVIYHQLNQFQVEAAASGFTYAVEDIQVLSRDTDKEVLLITYTVEGAVRQVQMTFHGQNRFTKIDIELQK